MSFGYIVQAAYSNWSGGRDDCVKDKDNLPLVEHTILRLIEINKINDFAFPILLVCPDSDQAKKYYSVLADKHNISVFFGSVENVLQRLVNACKKHGIEYFARINGAFWYIDKPLFSRLVDLQIQNKYDLLRVPTSYPKGLSAEFSSLHALERLEKLNETKGKPISSPFAEMENYQGVFNVCEYVNLPEISKKQVAFIKAGRRQYEPEQVEFDPEKMHAVGSIDYQRYKKALTYLQPSDVVLDIACGSGYGSHMISKQCHTVIGGDYNQTIVDKCIENYQAENLTYELANVTSLPYAASTFDVVVSMETIEHVDEDAYLSEIARVLKPKGRFILSTPQNEWGFTLVPWHVKEYGLDEIKECLSKKFKILKIHGINSHIISDNNETGDRMLIVAEKH